MEHATNASVSSHPDSVISEEQRHKLRRLEVALIQYCESLEERGIKSVDELEKNVAAYKKQLESKYGLDSRDDGSRNIPYGTWRSKSERRDKWDGSLESSRKRNRSISPLHRSVNIDRSREDADWDGEPDRRRDREKSGSRERDDHERDRDGDKERERMRRVK